MSWLKCVGAATGLIAAVLLVVAALLLGVATIQFIGHEYGWVCGWIAAIFFGGLVLGSIVFVSDWVDWI